MADQLFPPGPNPPSIEVLNAELSDRKILETHYFTHMSETQAKAMKDVAKNTYAVPARQETYRYYAGIAVVLLISWKLLPVFIDSKPSATVIALVIVGAFAVAGAKPIVEAVAKALKGS